jgi:hypothetical protein
MTLEAGNRRGHQNSKPGQPKCVPPQSEYRREQLRGKGNQSSSTIGRDISGRYRGDDEGHSNFCRSGIQLFVVEKLNDSARVGSTATSTAGKLSYVLRRKSTQAAPDRTNLPAIQE